MNEQLIMMEKYGLTPSEYFVVELIFMTQEGYEESYLLRYLKLNKSTFRDDLVSLQNKGIILKSWNIPEKGSKFDPLEIPLNKNFFKNMFKSSLELGKQLFEAYPMFVNINGYTYSLRSFAKKFDTIEDFFRFYGKTIHWDLDLHNKILDLIKWEQDNNIGFLTMSVCNFVIENKWNELEALKNGDIVNINFDTIQQL
jgi:hypothetical protein